MKTIPPLPPRPLSRHFNLSRWEAWLRRVTGAKHTEILQGVSPDIQPGLDAGFNRYNDHLLPAGISLWGVKNSVVAGGAGVRPVFCIINPAGSGALVTVDAMQVELTSGAAWFPTWWALHVGMPATAAQENSFHTDFRAVRTPSAIAVLPLLSGGENVAVATTPQVYFGSPGTNQIYAASGFPAIAGDRKTQLLPFPVVLAPGTGIGVDLQIANVPAAMWAQGTMRFPEPQELTVS